MDVTTLISMVLALVWAVLLIPVVNALEEKMRDPMILTHKHEKDRDE
jgi:CHASE2 domain-containing sensor protein